MPGVLQAAAFLARIQLLHATFRATGCYFFRVDLLICRIMIRLAGAAAVRLVCGGQASTAHGRAVLYVPPCGEGASEESCPAALADAAGRFLMRKARAAEEGGVEAEGEPWRCDVHNVRRAGKLKIKGASPDFCALDAPVSSEEDSEERNQGELMRDRRREAEDGNEGTAHDATSAGKEQPLTQAGAAEQVAVDRIAQAAPREGIGCV